MSDLPAKLVRGEDGAIIEAVLRNGLNPSDLTEIEQSWNGARLRLVGSLMAGSIPLSDWPQSLPWDWALKAPELELLHATAFGVIFDENWQGVMLTKTATDFARLPDDSGKPIVYIDYLESAPWNWNVAAIDQRGEYKGVGSILFRQGVVQSFSEGFNGRVGLHSLPQANGFYEFVCGMTSLGPDPQKQNLSYFELVSEQAHKYLETGGAQ